VATVETVGSTSTPYYLHTDHLSGSNVLTDDSGELAETTDYYPFGEMRLNDQRRIQEQRKFIGEDFDEDTELSYLNARYYDGTAGRFLSQDPIYLALASENEELLKDPQQLNSYSYAANNPLRYSDPTGEGIKETLESIKIQLDSLQRQLEALQVAVGRATENYSQGSGILNQTVNTLTETMTPAYIAGGIGVTALGGAGALYYGGTVAGIPALQSLSSTCILFCDDATQAVDKSVKLLNGPINISQQRAVHVIEGHRADGVYNTGKSVFNSGEKVFQLIRQGTQHPITQQAGGNFQRVFDAGRNIGTYNATGGQTTTMTIITDKAGNLITAFPGPP
jgi:RHS repeat-associated protein